MKEITPRHTIGAHAGIRHDHSFNLKTQIGESSFDANGDRNAKWSIIHNGIRGYNDTFFRVLETRNLSRFLRLKVDRGENTAILDLMASELFSVDVVERGFQHGVAVSLGYPHDPYWDRVYGSDAVITINGDVTHEETWADIAAVKRQIAPAGFDVIISRPEGGLKANHLGNNVLLVYLILQKMWLMGAETSTLLFQVPKRYEYEFERYTKELQDVGVDVQYPGRFSRRCISFWKHPNSGGSSFGIPARIEKTPTSPRLLPRPNFITTG